jgi:TPR repeat protein
MYYAGDTVPKDPKEALKWFRMAAQAGNGRAQFNLATLYTNAEGTPQNLARAVVWFNAAAVTLTGEQSKIADENSKAVAAKMTRDQLLAAKEMALKCKVGDYKDCE